MPHKGDLGCPYNSIAVCDRARYETMGRCQEMIGDREPSPCTNWAVETVGERKVCGQHANAFAQRADREARLRAKRVALDARIDTYNAWAATNPSVWDPMPR